jgi:hypothetical protein
MEKEKQKEVEGREKVSQTHHCSSRHSTHSCLQEREIKLNQLQEAEEVTKAPGESEEQQAAVERVREEEGATASTTGVVAAVGGGASGKCNTCVISFQSPEEHKAHYRYPLSPSLHSCLSLGATGIGSI